MLNQLSALRQYTSASTVKVILVCAAFGGLKQTAITGQTSASPQSASKRVVLEAYHLCGFGEAKPHSRGLLSVSREKLMFESPRHSDNITQSEITHFDLDGESRALLPGLATPPIQFAPYEAGLFTNRVRTADDVLTLDYRDSRGGLHEAVLLISSDTGGPFGSYLSSMHIQPISAVNSSNSGNTVTAKSEAKHSRDELSKYTAVQIGRFDISTEDVPASVRAVLYEELIAHLRASGYFGQVLRAGENPEKPIADLATLNVSIQSFAKGSSRLREVTVISGRPHLSAAVQITGPSGNVILDRTLNAALTGRGEDLDVCENMSKKVVKLFER